MTDKPIFANLNIPAAGSSLSDGIRESLTPKFDKDGKPETQMLYGIFQYVDGDEGWGDTFRVVDIEGCRLPLTPIVLSRVAA